MCEAVLLDLKHGCSPACLGAAPPGDSPVFLLRGSRSPEDVSGSSGAFQSACGGSVHVLDSGSTAESLYRLKQTVDRLQLSSIRVLTTPQGRDVLLLYQQLLFTAVYTFDYVTCPSCTGPAHTDSPGGGGGGVQEEVSVFVQQLPALKGEVTVLKSTLIPDCFGHGFTTRRGGVSSVPTLSSLNLFSSSRRRDPVAVVTENRRRLAVHAGFHPQPLRLVKVDHGSNVWVVGSTEPESYDAMVTDQMGVVLAAPGADCMPVLFADPVSKVIGAAHAGWRGTLMGVAAATVNAMVKGFGCRASDIVVAVGPSVGACCYTMERETALGFQHVHPDCVADPESARPHVDIRLANSNPESLLSYPRMHLSCSQTFLHSAVETELDMILLQRAGVLPQHIHDHTDTGRPCVTPCTACHPEDFFSHVRDGLNFGTQLGFLWIREAPETL